MAEKLSMSQFASKADYDAAADAAELKRLRAMFAAATEVQGDDEVLKYVTSGNAIPVTRCTVSADLIRQLVARSAGGESRLREELRRLRQWFMDRDDRPGHKAQVIYIDGVLDIADSAARSATATPKDSWSGELHPDYNEAQGPFR
jgi:hypothetical protein